MPVRRVAQRWGLERGQVKTRQQGNLGSLPGGWAIVPRLRERPSYQMWDLGAGITDKTLIGRKGTAARVESPELWNLGHSKSLMAQDSQEAYLGQAWEWRSETLPWKEEESWSGS